MPQRTLSNEIGALPTDDRKPTFAEMAAVRQLVEKLGGIERAKAVIDLLAQERG